MATEEKEISELEFRKNLSGDDLIPVETSTNTFATTLTAIKNWLKSFFVGKTGDETIAGNKLFTRNILFDNINGRVIQGRKNNNTKSYASVEFTNDRNKNRASLFVFNENETANANITLNYNNGNPFVVGPSSDNINTFITTLGLSKNTNGYVKLGNGIMIQWFEILAGSSVTFPTPFDNACSVVVGADTSANSLGVTNITKTGFNYSQSYNLPRMVHFLAVGY